MKSLIAKSLALSLIIAGGLRGEEPVPVIQVIDPTSVQAITIQPDGNLIVQDLFAEQIRIVVPIVEEAQPVPVPVPTSNLRRNGKSRIAQPLPKEYEAHDKNGDGQIGLYEWDRAKYAEFMKLDKNGDGFLTALELGAKGKSVVTARVKLGSDKEALPNPASLTAYNQKIGESFNFTVTGQLGGSVWGTGTYTTDSSLATAAIHAGVLANGETGLVRVTMVQSPNQFTSSTANGVTSGPWAAFPAAYTVSK
ncbi:MAG: LCCL domain-containing protein [Planctomycetota bacterium]